MIEPAPHRRGEPSPLIFHLNAALAGYGQALLAAPRADAPEFPWAPHLAASGRALGPDLDRMEVAAEIAARLAATIRGVEIWQAHPYRRDVAEPPAIWSCGSARLLDYGAAPEATDPRGPPVLMAPSLINRAYILDLDPERSLLRWLAAQGLRPVLLDWGPPGAAEARFGLEEYAALRLAPAIRRLREDSGRPVALLGYCMGGTLGAGFAARDPGDLAALATIGAPWDFGTTQGFAGGLRAALRAEGAEWSAWLIDGMAEAFGLVPADLFQALFALIDPIQATLKFQKFARLDPDGPEASAFAAVEDWLADGVPMAGPAAKALLVDWQIRNLPAAGDWRLLGGLVDLGAIRLPTLAFCGRADAIATPPMASALPAAIPGAQVARPATGHVGMVIGGAALSQVWRPLASFLHAHAG